MDNQQFSTLLHSIIDQYGIPVSETIPRFKSLLQDYFVDNPREMNLLIAGLEEGLPGQLHAKKGMIPYDIIAVQMVDRLYNSRGMDRQAAVWVVRTWAGAIGFSIPTVQSPSTLFQNINNSDVQNKQTGSTQPSAYNQKEEIIESQVKSGDLSKDLAKERPKNFSSHFKSSEVSGHIPLTTKFLPDYLNPNASYHWNFGDGTESKEQKPVHEYTKEGVYSVSLTITQDGYSVNRDKKRLIEVKPKSQKDSSLVCPQSPNDNRIWAILGIFGMIIIIFFLPVPSIWNDWGDSLFKSGQYGTAILAYDQAIRLDPQHYIFSWSGKINSLYALGRYNEVIDICDQVLIIYPDSYTGMLYKGKSLSKLNRNEEATEIFNEMLKKHPGIKEVIENRDLVVRKIGITDDN